MAIRGAWGVNALTGAVTEPLASWALSARFVHTVYPSKRGLLPSVRALLDYLGACFREPRED